MPTSAPRPILTIKTGDTPPMGQETPQACSLLGRFAQLCGLARH